MERLNNKKMQLENKRNEFQEMLSNKQDYEQVENIRLNKRGKKKMGNF